jgi:hypothetical protein
MAPRGLLADAPDFVTPARQKKYSFPRHEIRRRDIGKKTASTFHS